MAHGENAEKRGHAGKEYCRPRGGLPMATPGRFSKRHTHRVERRARCRLCDCEIPWGQGDACDACDAAEPLAGPAAP
jgi:hypothetical protein